MAITKITALAALLALSACATCEHHPVACTAAVAIIGTSIALSVRHDGDHARAKPATCENNPSFPNGCAPIGD